MPYANIIGNIVPRLYLMVTVGTVYMSIPDAPVQEIMKDMMEMCRGVQHPIRGLFLRYYLSQGARDYLPIGNNEGPVGNLQDSIQFVITNFIEMNKLWVRLQHQGHSREREKRTKERKELQILVGSNLVRLSNLEGIDKEYYRTSILPAILEQVVQCRDVIAQEYLLDVVSQVFPDEFHLYTLDLFLNATANLNPGASVKKIILALVNRLAEYSAREAENGSSTPEETEDDGTEHTEDVTAALEKATIEDKGESDSEDVKKEDSNEDVKEESSEDKEQDTEKTEDGDESKDAGNSESKDEVKDASTEPFSPPKSTKAVPVRRGVPINIDLFDIFWSLVAKLLAARPDLPIEDVTALYVGIARLSLSCYPERTENIDKILEFILNKVESLKDTPDVHSEVTTANILELLRLLIRAYPRLLTVLSLKSFIPLLNSQPVKTQKDVALAVIDSVLSDKNYIETVEDAEGLFGLVRFIICEGEELANKNVSSGLSKLMGDDDEGSSEPVSDSTLPDNILNDQSSLAKVVHLLYNKDPEIQANLLNAARKALSEGKSFVRFTYPALITSALKLVRRFKTREKVDSEWQEKIGSTFKFVQLVISDINKYGKADKALRFFVDSAMIADQVGSEEASYEFYAQAFSVYEESISDSRAQYQAICVIAGALQSSRNFSLDNYDTLVSKCALYGSKLLKKPDQCRAVYYASHLWWAVEIPALGEQEGVTQFFRDGKRVLECLQRALRVADACMDVAVSVELFVEILNRCIYFFDRGNEQVSVKFITGLIELIQRNLGSITDGSISDSPRKHFERTLKFINDQKDVDDRYNQIIVS